MYDRPEELNIFFKETSELYSKINSYGILLEKLAGGKVEIASVNELRAVLFHVYRFLEIPNPDLFKTSIDYIEAQEHLYRAYYDLFSAICNLLIVKIHQYLPDYGALVIGQVYDRYYKVILPNMTELKEKISLIRANRENSLDENHKIIGVLLKWYKELQSVTGGFVLRKEELKSAKKNDRIEKFVIAIIAAIVGAVLKGIFFK